MMKNLSPEEENIIKNKWILFRLKKEQKYTAMKDVINLFRREKETKAIKDRIPRDIKNFSEHEEEENYYKPVRVSNFCSNSYIEYESISDKNKTLSVKKYLKKIRPYLKGIINVLMYWHVENSISNSK